MSAERWGHRSSATRVFELRESPMSALVTLLGAGLCTRSGREIMARWASWEGEVVTRPSVACSLEWVFYLSIYLSR